MLNSTLRCFFTFILVINCLAGSAQPVASFTASPTSGCTPLTVAFTNTSTGATSYSWNFNNGNPPSTQTNPTATFIGANVYTVYLTATSGSQSSTYSLQIHVYDAPNVNFIASPTAVCLGQPITFTDQSTLNAPGAASYQWNFGNGQSQTGSPTSYTYPSAGVYSVTEVVTNSQGCVSSFTRTNYITINAPPVVSFSASPSPTCTNVPVSFTNSSSGYGNLTSTWDFGDGTPHVTAANPTHSYTSPGSYSVTLKVVDGLGCTDSVTYTNYIIVVAGTVAAFTGPTSICAGQTATFTNTSSPGFTSCTWTFGDGNTGVGSPASDTYTSAGTYQVTLTSTNNNCSSSVTHPIVVNALPVPNISFSPTQPCPAPQSISFSTSTPGTNYYWDFGDGTLPSTSQNPTHTYNSNDSFTITLVVTNSFGCKDTAVFPYYVKIYPLMVQMGDSSGNGCVPFTVCFFDSAGYYYYPTPTSQPSWVAYPYGTANWTWNFGDGSAVSHQPFPCHTYTAYGTYNVILNITTNNGCPYSDTMTILAGTPDTANFTASPLTGCVYDYIYFTNLSSGATNYVWDFGDGTGSSMSAPNNGVTHQYHYPGTYTVTLDAIKNGCGDTMKRTAYITIHNPKSIFQQHYSCTNNYSVSFTNMSIGATSYNWNYGDGSALDSTHLNPTHIYNSNGTFLVILSTYNDTFGCVDTASVYIIISQPVASITVADTANCKGSPVTLTGVLGGGAPAPVYNAYTWLLDGTGYYDTAVQRTHVFNTIGQKPVMLKITDYRGCIDTAYKTLLIAWPNVQFTASPLAVCLQTPVTFTDQSTDAVTTHFTSRT